MASGDALMGARKKRKGKNFIAGAIKRPGSLHRALNVPEGQTIPQGKVQAAANSSNPDLARKARFAKVLAGVRGK